MKEKYLFILFIQYEKEVSLRAISRVNTSNKIVSNQLKIHTINISNGTLYIVQFFIGFDSLFWINFRNETASLWVNNLINKDAKWTCMVS